MKAQAFSVGEPRGSLCTRPYMLGQKSTYPSKYGATKPSRPPSPTTPWTNEQGKVNKAAATSYPVMGWRGSEIYLNQVTSSHIQW